MARPPDDVQIEEANLPAPTGTTFLLGIYVALIAGIWGTLYAMMLSR
jgi:hypothetical protein